MIDIFVSPRRDGAAARRVFHLGARAFGAAHHGQAKALIGAVQDVTGDADHDTAVYANNRVESDHARLKARFDRCAA